MDIANRFLFALNSATCAYPRHLRPLTRRKFRMGKNLEGKDGGGGNHDYVHAGVLPHRLSTHEIEPDFHITYKVLLLTSYKAHPMLLSLLARLIRA
jgi:hypothetical protein